jgi:hypothetical protein
MPSLPEGRCRDRVRHLGIPNHHRVVPSSPAGHLGRDQKSCIPSAALKRTRSSSFVLSMSAVAVTSAFETRTMLVWAVA